MLPDPPSAKRHQLAKHAVTASEHWRGLQIGRSPPPLFLVIPNRKVAMQADEPDMIRRLLKEDLGRFAGMPFTIG